MKNLIYKELKLSMHFTCYLFPLLFGIFMAIPNYPSFVAPLYSIVCYPILFLGANKGQSTNDLFYTCNLPIRKRDVVKARIMTVTLLHIFSIVSTAAFMPVGIAVTNSIGASGGEMAYLGLGTYSFLAFYGVTLLGYSLCDFVFLPWFYKTGHSITAPALVAIMGFIVYSVVFYMVIPMAVPGLAILLDIRYGGTTGLIVQFAIFGVGLILYVLSRFLVYKISYKRLEKLDF